ncbi:MAG TPA: UDP-N-acetylmuramate dehydrogenase [Acidobacteriaceae bacterium]|nr:UDP-N-acetylmuramate dehydrogenase [Acidobacteriaceae bacterium]
MTIREKVSLAPYTTFGIGGPARYFAVAESEEDVAEAVAWAEQHRLPLFVLGGGSNLLVSDAGFDGLVLQIGIRGVEACGEACGQGCLDVGAGEVWDEFVDRVVRDGLAGVECLAGIPGSVGGTPVQNVGAYGQEVAETIVSVRAFDHQTHRFVDLDREACRFRYRKSVFNSDEPERYIVTRVRYQLHPDGEPKITYADLKRRFANRNETIDLKEVASSVREIRHAKGMLIVEGDPDCRSAGSFFKNPVVAAQRLPEVADAAGVAAEAVPHWPAGEDRTKLSAAWLIERAGFQKGFVDGAAGISSRHTLALINRGAATCADVERLQARIAAAVEAKFGVRLEREPVLLK